MTHKLRLDSQFANRVDSPAVVERELAAQMRIFADSPSEGLLWSDLADGVRAGVSRLRRTLATRRVPVAN